MHEFRETFLYRVGFLVLIVLAAVVLIASSYRVSAASSAGSGSVASGEGALAGLAAFGRLAGGGVHAVAAAADAGVAFVEHSAQHSVAFLAGGVSGSVRFAGRLPGDIFRPLAGALHLDAVIRPADSKAAFPTITAVDTVPAAQAAPREHLQPQAPAAPAAQSVPAPQWPLHGDITTYFGAPDPPYERFHTGIDISDHKPAGTTPVLPFKPGRVIQVVHAGYGLGNHVVIDHGGGVTSVYGHLYSTAVGVGQLVDENTVLGREGSTGDSTGTHLHFEIRVGGRPVNPQTFISGRP